MVIDELEGTPGHDGWGEIWGGNHIVRMAIWRVCFDIVIFEEVDFLPVVEGDEGAGV